MKPLSRLFTKGHICICYRCDKEFINKNIRACICNRCTRQIEKRQKGICNQKRVEQ